MTLFCISMVRFCVFDIARCENETVEKVFVYLYRV